MLAKLYHYFQTCNCSTIGRSIVVTRDDLDTGTSESICIPIKSVSDIYVRDMIDFVKKEFQVVSCSVAVLDTIDCIEVSVVSVCRDPAVVVTFCCGARNCNEG